MENKNTISKTGTGTGTGTEEGNQGKRVETERLRIPKKRGRRKKADIQEKKELKDQSRFIIDVSGDLDAKDILMNVLKQANDKAYGREVNLKDLLLILLSKVTTKDIEKLQENSLTDKEKIQKSHIEFNRRNNSNLSFDEFLIRRLGIS